MHLVLGVENGDVVAVYGSLDEAKAELAAFVESHPERCDELAIATIDDTGHAVVKHVFVPAPPAVPIDGYIRRGLRWDSS